MNRLLNRVPAAVIATGIIVPVLSLGLAARIEDPKRYSEWGPPVHLGQIVNSQDNDMGPSISKDGLSLYFQSNRSGTLGNNDIYVSQRSSTDEPWGLPQNLGPMINSTSGEGLPTLSPDSHLLFFNSNRPGGFGNMDLYVSRRHNKRDDFGWLPPENLGPAVNSASSDSMGFIFEDDVTGVITLYFTSNRPGGLGASDLYMSTLDAEGTFGPPVPVTELNSSGEDRYPTIRRDGLEIFFASTRPGSIPLPGFPMQDDVWVSTRASTSEPWSAPVNLWTINTAYYQGYPKLSFDETALYFATSPPPSLPQTSLDLWVVMRTKLTGK